MSIPRVSSFPRMARLKQQFPGPMLHDIPAAVRETLSRLALPVKPGQTVALGVGKHRGAIQAHRANIRHRYETVVAAVGREMLRKARIAFGLGIVENGYDESAKVQAFLPAAMEAGGGGPPRGAEGGGGRRPPAPIGPPLGAGEG